MRSSGGSRRDVQGARGAAARIDGNFLGSVTTLITSEQLGRSCFGLEIDPAYCDVVVQRWEQLTGGKATRIQP